MCPGSMGSREPDPGCPLTFGTLRPPLLQIHQKPENLKAELQLTYLNEPLVTGTLNHMSFGRGAALGQGTLIESSQLTDLLCSEPAYGRLWFERQNSLSQRGNVINGH